MTIAWLRGNTAQNNAYTGPNGTISLDIQKGSIRLHNGTTPGGYAEILSEGIDAESLAGMLATSSNEGSTIVARSSSGYVSVNTLRPEYASLNPSSTSNFFWTSIETGSGDNYLRPTSLEAVRNAVKDFATMPTSGGDPIISEVTSGSRWSIRYASGRQVCGATKQPLVLSTSRRVSSNGVSFLQNFITTEGVTLVGNVSGVGSVWSHPEDRDISLSTRVTGVDGGDAVVWKTSAATFRGTSGEWHYTATGRWK